MLRIGARQQWGQLLLYHQPRRVDRLIRKKRMLPGDTLPPAAQPFATQLHQQDAPLGRGSKTGLKWFDKGKA
jgi:hypothetical protein